MHRGLPPSSSRLARAVLAASLVAASALACGGGAERDGGDRKGHRGPIVLVTLEAVRADRVGALGGEEGLTPTLDRLAAREDTWLGRGVAASSWAPAATASILSGLSVWHHQVLHPESSRLQQGVELLPEALAGLGFETTAFIAESALTEGRGGFDQGFETWAELDSGQRAAQHLGTLGREPELVWIHLADAGPPYVRRDWVRPRDPEQAAARAGLPARIGRREVERWHDPARELPEWRRRSFSALYGDGVAWTDERLRRLLAALAEGGSWDRTLVVVAGTHGQALGERGHAGEGGGLGRELLEVPLLIKPPRGAGRFGELPRAAGDRVPRVATARLAATLLDAVGGRPAPALAPSLLRPAPGPGPEPILSELYFEDGVNRFSLVEGDLQLLRRVRYAIEEPAYYPARQARVTGRQHHLDEPAGRIFRRLAAAFDVVRPFTGMGPPAELAVERWEGPSGTAPVSDPAVAERLARRLEERWYAFLDDELPPAQERRRWHRPRSGGGS